MLRLFGMLPSLLEKENGTPLLYSCVGNPVDRGTWQATVHGVARVGHNLMTKPPLPLNSLEPGFRSF